MLVSQVIRATLRLLQVTSPTAAEENDALEALNIMLMEWSTSPLGLYKLTRENFTTTATVGAYTIGSGADFNTARPNKIGVSFLRDGTIDTKITPISADNYALRLDKSTTGQPVELYYEKGYPQGTVFLWPVPDKEYGLFLYSQKPLASYTSLSDDLNLPPEYIPAIKYNLAIAVAPEFGISVSQEVALGAETTMKSLKRLHATPVTKICTNPFSRSSFGVGHDGLSDGSQLLYDQFDFPIG